MKPTIILSSSDYSDSYDEDVPTNSKKDLNTTDSESDNDDSGEKVVIKTFHPNKSNKNPTIPVNNFLKRKTPPANKFFRKPKMNIKIFDLRLDDESSSQESYSYSYEEEETNCEDQVKTKIIKNKIQNEKTKDLNHEEEEIPNIENMPNDQIQSVENTQISENQSKKSNTNKNNQTNQNTQNQPALFDTNKNDQINKSKEKHAESSDTNENDQINQNELNQLEQNTIQNVPINQKDENHTELSQNQIITIKNDQIEQIKENHTELDSNQIKKDEETKKIKSETNQNSENQSDENESSEEPQTIQSKEKEEDDDDEVNPPIIKINNFQSKPSITYSIVRKLESSLLTKNNSYSFYLESLQKFYSKTKARNTEQQIPLFEGPTVNFKKKPSYELIADKEFKFFTLKKMDNSDVSLMNLKVFFDSLLMLPRHIDIQIFTSPEMMLTTKNPKMSTRGHWVLDFNGKYTIPSERNMIFVSAKEKNGADLIYVRQISNNEIDIDLCTDMDEIFVFAIGLSIFIAKLS